MNRFFAMLMLFAPTPAYAQILWTGDVVTFRYVYVCNTEEGMRALRSGLEKGGSFGLASAYFEMDQKRKVSGVDGPCNFHKEPVMLTIGERIGEPVTADADDPEKKQTWYIVSVELVPFAGKRYFFSTVPVINSTRPPQGRTWDV